MSKSEAMKQIRAEWEHFFGNYYLTRARLYAYSDQADTRIKGIEPGAECVAGHVLMIGMRHDFQRGVQS